MKTLIILAVWVFLTLLIYFVPTFIACFLLANREDLTSKAGCALWLVSLIAGFLATLLLVQNGYLLV